MNAWLPQASYPCGFFSVASSVTAQYTKLFVLKIAPPLRKIIHLPYRQSSTPHTQFKNKKGILFLNFEFRTKSKLTHSTHIKQISSWNKYLMGREDFHQHKRFSGSVSGIHAGDHFHQHKHSSRQQKLPWTWL